MFLFQKDIDGKFYISVFSLKVSCMKDKLKSILEALFNKGYDEADNKFKFPPSVDTVVKKIVIPAGAVALATFIFELYNQSPK